MIERHGKIDVLVSNAGITRDQLMLRMKRADWDEVLATNLTAAFTLCQAVLKPMIRQRSGRIVAISSVVGPDRQCRAGQLRGVEGRPDRLLQIAGEGSGLAERHRQRRRARA